MNEPNLKIINSTVHDMKIKIFLRPFYNKFSLNVLLTPLILNNIINLICIYKNNYLEKDGGSRINGKIS